MPTAGTSWNLGWEAKNDRCRFPSVGDESSYSRVVSTLMHKFVMSYSNFSVVKLKYRHSIESLGEKMECYLDKTKIVAYRDGSQWSRKSTQKVGNMWADAAWNTVNQSFIRSKHWTIKLIQQLSSVGWCTEKEIWSPKRNVVKTERTGGKIIKVWTAIGPMCFVQDSSVSWLTLWSQSICSSTDKVQMQRSTPDSFSTFHFSSESCENPFSFHYTWRATIYFNGAS